MFRSERIHHHLNTLSKINTALAIGSLVAVLGLYVWLQVSDRPTTSTTAPSAAVTAAESVDMEQVAADYRSAINRIFSKLDVGDAAAAENASFSILELTVPPELKQFHLSAVLALSDASKGDADAARARLSDLAENYGWFAPQL